jgi:hypothetical protein
MHLGVDLNALAVKACKSLADKEAAKRRALESGVREYQWDLKVSLAVAQESAPPLPNDPLRAPRTKWATLSTPDGIPTLTAYGSLPEAQANGWTLHELMLRRMRRAYRDALVGQKVEWQEANRRAREVEIFVADLGIAQGA